MNENTPASPSDYPSNPSELYDTASKLAQSGDQAAWDRLIEYQIITLSDPLNEWFRKWQWPTQKSISDELAEQISLEGLKVLEPLLAVALAGVSSRTDGINRQEKLIHDLLVLPSRVRSGIDIVYFFHEAAAFVFQALLGTFAVHTKQIGLVFELANQPLKLRRFPGVAPLWNSPYVVQYPTPLDNQELQGSNEVWRFIWNLTYHFPWMLKGLSTNKCFRECLCGHYFLLSFVEFVGYLDENPKLLDANIIHLSVPTYFSVAPEFGAALQIILDEKEKLLDYADRNGVSKDALRQGWPKWVNESRFFLRAMGLMDHSIKFEGGYTQFMENLMK